ncbi:hypothetical protein GCM10028801_13410 [Nocardioides maradonensis]
MFVLTTEQWSPMTWTLLFAVMATAILSVLVTFVVVLVRASGSAPPSRPNLVGHDGDNRATDVEHHHPHAA